MIENTLDQLHNKSHTATLIWKLFIAGDTQVLIHALETIVIV